MLTIGQNMHPYISEAGLKFAGERANRTTEHAWSGLLLTTGYQASAFNWANFVMLQPGAAIEMDNQGEPGLAGNQARGRL